MFITQASNKNIISPRGILWTCRRYILRVWSQRDFVMLANLFSIMNLSLVTLRRDLAATVQRLYLSHWLIAPKTLKCEEVEAILEESARLRGVNLSDFLDPFYDPQALHQYGPYRPSGVELAAMLLAFLPNLTRLSQNHHTWQSNHRSIIKRCWCFEPLSPNH
ncbi:hypothetical protein F4778DRAFT_460736 [Xylariomycetidae sp. FL2044]|nr:hypothetical protein F4778DRAFT_460736 [Xylariomycetidae sp. FL2044]